MHLANYGDCFEEMICARRSKICDAVNAKVSKSNEEVRNRRIQFREAKWGEMKKMAKEENAH